MHFSIGIGKHQLATDVERKANFLWLSSTKLFGQVRTDLGGLFTSNSQHFPEESVVKIEWRGLVSLQDAHKEGSFAWVAVPDEMHELMST